MPRIPIERQPLSMDVSGPTGESRAGLQLGAAVAGFGESLTDAAMTVQQDLQRTMNTIEVEKAKSDFSIRALEKQRELEQQFDAEYIKYNPSSNLSKEAADWRKSKTGLTTQRYKQWLEEERPKYEASFGTETARLEFVSAYEREARQNLQRVYASDLARTIENEERDFKIHTSRMADEMISNAQQYDPNVDVSGSKGNEWYQKVTNLSTSMQAYIPLWGREKVEKLSADTKAMWGVNLAEGMISDATNPTLAAKYKKTGTEILTDLSNMLDEKDAASLWALRTGRVPFNRLLTPDDKSRLRQKVAGLLSRVKEMDSSELSKRRNDMRAYLRDTVDVNQAGIGYIVQKTLLDKSKSAYENAKALGDMWNGAREGLGRPLLSASPDGNLDTMVDQILSDTRIPRAQAYLPKNDPNYETLGREERAQVKTMLVNLKEQMAKDRADDSAMAMAKHIPGMSDIATMAELRRVDLYPKNSKYVKDWIAAVDRTYEAYKSPRRVTVTENGKNVTKMVTGSAYSSDTGEKRYYPKEVLTDVLNQLNTNDLDVANKMATNIKITYGRASSNVFDQLAEAPGSNKLWKSVGAFPADSNIQRLTIKAIQHQKGLIAFAPSAFERAKQAADTNQLFSSYASSAKTDDSRHSADLLNNMKTLIALRAVEMAGMDNTAESVEGSMGNISMHVENATREIFDQLFVTFTKGDLYGTHFPKKVMDKYQGAINTTETGLKSFIDNNLKTLEGINGLNITYPSIMQDGKVRPMNEFDKASFVKQVGSSARLIHSYRADKNGEITHGVMVAYRKRLNDGTQISSYEYLADKEGRRLFIPLDVVMKGIHEVQKYTKSTLFEPKAKGP